MDDFASGPIDFTDLVAWRVTADSTAFTIIFGFLTAGIGLSGINLRKLAAVGALVSWIRDPWLLVGNLNVNQKSWKTVDGANGLKRE